MNNFRTYDLAVEFYKATRGVELTGTLKEQFSRACPSIALNLAEGSAKYSKKDQNRFFQIAYGSMRECFAILELADIKNPDILELANKLSAHIYKLMKNNWG